MNYQPLLDVLKSLETIQELSYVGEDWGQLNYQQPPVKFPCALVDISSLEIEQMGRTSEAAQLNIVVTLADLRMDGISPNLKGNNAEQAFALYRIAEKVHSLLQGLQNGDYSTMIRSSLQKITRDDSIRELQLIYSCNVQTL